MNDERDAAADVCVYERLITRLIAASFLRRCGLIRRTFGRLAGDGGRSRVFPRNFGSIEFVLYIRGKLYEADRVCG